MLMTFGPNVDSPGERPVARLLAAFALLCLGLSLCAAGSTPERKVQKRVQPIYPELAKRMHVGGVVRISATVAPDGTVTEVKTISGSRLLSPAAEDAVKKWRFVAADAESIVNLDINFEPDN